MDALPNVGRFFLIVLLSTSSLVGSTFVQVILKSTPFLKEAGIPLEVILIVLLTGILATFIIWYCFSDRLTKFQANVWLGSIFFGWFTGLIRWYIEIAASMTGS